MRDLICPALQSRIDFHVTSYRGSQDRTEKAWITVDGRRVWTCSGHKHQWHGWPGDAEGRLDSDGSASEPLDKDQAGIFLPQHLGQSLRDYLDMPIEDVLQSSDPFIRALGIIDRRIGRRTVRALRIDDNEHAFIREFYNLRIAADERAPTAPD